jgi:transcriptional regulator with XRE-family HTH domain
MPTVQQLVGANIRRIRERQEMTQQTLYELAGLGRTHLSKIENGKSGSLQLKTIEKIAHALDVPMRDLLKGCP